MITATNDDEIPDLAELDRLLNDPDVPMQAWRVWEMAERVAQRVGAPA